MYSCYMGNGKNTKASDSVPHNFSDCGITNSVTTIPVYDKMPKQQNPFPCFLVNNWFPHHLRVIKIVTHFTTMSNTRINWYQVKKPENIS